MTPFARYFHTLRHLRPVQVYGRLWFRLYRPRPDSWPAPPLRIVAGGFWVAPQHWFVLGLSRDDILGLFNLEVPAAA